MPSPFPGMNPYLEQDDAWRDFRERFYDAAYYRDYIYDGTPWPPLAGQDAAWARQLAAGEMV